MNEQLPPVERSLADQLARRSAGRPPAGLLNEVLSAVDSTPSAPVVRLAGFRANARVSGALVGLAAVVVLVAALVAVPVLRNSPAATSLPTDRALTTAELGALMSGPALPINTALVANVTIQPRADVCPMNRYATLGVIEGTPSQVCVMTASTPIDIVEGGPRTAVFAFRYLAPGVLGFLGQIATPSSGLAFKVADQWPAPGEEAFVVDGWLGNTRPAGYADSCAEVASAGDVLSPEGQASCPRSQDWLADSATASGIDGPAATALANRSIDPIALFGNARLVQAYGARQIDRIDETNPQNAPVHGRYVVKVQVGACPGLPDVSSVGCAHWLVLAKLSDNLPINVAPSVTPAASEPGLAGYPIERALSVEEFGRLAAVGKLQSYDTVVVDAKLAKPSGVSCPAIDASYAVHFAGVIAEIEPPICVYTRVYGGADIPVEPGNLVLRKLGDGIFGYMGTVPAGPKSLAYSPTDNWPQTGDFLVHGWLDTDATDCGASSLPARGGPDPLFPVYSGMCHAAMTTGAYDPGKAKPAQMTTNPSQRIPTFEIPPDGKAIDSGPYFSVPASQVATGSVEGTFLVHGEKHCSIFVADDCEQHYALARLADIAIPVPIATKPPDTFEPPTTPVPEPSVMATTAPVDGTYPSSRAITTDELGGVLQSDGIKDKVVVANTFIETGTPCPTLGGYQAIGKIGGAEICVVGIGDGKAEHKPAGQSGIFAFRVLDSHTLGFMANLTEEPTGKFSYGPAQTWPSGKTILVTGWAAKPTGFVSSCPIVTSLSHDALDPGAIPCVGMWIVDQGPGQAFATTPPASMHPQQVWVPAYPTDGFLVPTDQATYLLRSNAECNSDTGPVCGWRILGVVDRLSAPAAPAPTASATASAAGAPGILAGPNGTPLTLAALYSAWRSDANHLAGRTVITKGPLPASTACLTPDGLTACSYAIAGEGYWVAKFGSDGKISLVGKLSVPKSGFMWTVEELNVFDTNSGALVVVDGPLFYDANCEDPSMQCSTSEIAGKVNIIASVNPGAYEAISGGSKGGDEIPGPFLVKLVAPYDTVLGKLETFTP